MKEVKITQALGNSLKGGVNLTGMAFASIQRCTNCGKRLDVKSDPTSRSDGTHECLSCRDDNIIVKRRVNE